MCTSRIEHNASDTFAASLQSRSSEQWVSLSTDHPCRAERAAGQKLLSDLKLTKLTEKDVYLNCSWFRLSFFLCRLGRRFSVARTLWTFRFLSDAVSHEVFWNVPHIRFVRSLLFHASMRPNHIGTDWKPTQYSRFKASPSATLGAIDHSHIWRRWEN